MISVAASAATPPLPTTFDRQQVEWLGQLVREEPYSESRRFAIEQLQGLRDPDALNVLSATLGDQDIGVREQAITAIGGHRQAGVYVLGQVLNNEPRGELRELALQLLADIHTPASGVLIRDASQHDPLAHIRAQAQEVLEGWPTEFNDEPINQVATAEEEYARIDEAWQLAPDRAAQRLGEIRDNSVHDQIRLQSVLDLIHLMHPSAIEPLGNALGDPEADIRNESLYGLAMHGTAGVYLLGQALISDPEPFVRTQALELLAADGSIAARTLMQYGLSDPAPELRQRASELLLD